MKKRPHVADFGTFGFIGSPSDVQANEQRSFQNPRCYRIQEVNILCELTTHGSRMVRNLLKAWYRQVAAMLVAFAV
jgi:hypothetical protein